MNRAYSVLTVKAVEDEQRVIRGTATTPRPDRVGDIVEPLGVQFTNPMPLLHQHDSDRPVGTVSFDKPTKDGITFEARLPKIEESGPLKDRVDTAWGEIKAGLVRAVSIGFRALEHAFLDDGGIRFIATEVLELSLVSVPANADARISTIKSIDAPLLAATGKEPKADDRPVPPASREKATKPVKLMKPEDIIMSGKKTVAEQISAFEATRQAKAARMAELMDESADEGVTLDAEQTEEYDGLEAEVKAVDDHLKRLRALEAANKAAAKPVNGEDGEKASDSRGGVVYAQPKRNLPKGTAFTRYAMAVAVGKGSISDALSYAERWKDSTPEVIAYIKATAGTSTHETWAGPLVYDTNLVSEFIDLLRPATIIGRLTGLRMVPFNVRIPRMTGGSTVNWVGEAAPKPVSDLAFDTVTLGYHKVAGIVVLTDELVRLSSPSAEAAVRTDLVEQIARFLDAQFVDPTVAAGANNPAAITNGVTAITAGGTTAEDLYFDLNTALATFDDTDLGTGNVAILMRPSTARGISALRNALGQFEFTGLSPMGGTLMGFPVIVSNSVPGVGSPPSGTIVIVKTDELFVADDGRVDLDASREATLDMAGGSSPAFSLWQKNCVGIRAERWMTWAKRRADAVAVIDGASYGPTAPA